MSPTDAARILDLAPDASPEQIETRFNELRAKLEDKIAKAPTPGLKVKYRETLTEITSAFEILTLASDNSSLPLARRQSAGSAQRPAPDPAITPAPTERPQATARKRKAGREFAVVAVIAVGLLLGVGWFLTKRESIAAAAQAEQAKKFAEEKAAKDSLAESQRASEAEAKQEAERQRIADKAEQERLEQLGAVTRTALAELRIAWEATEQVARAAERRVAELRSDLRNVDQQTPAGRQAAAEYGAEQEFSAWLSNQLLRHPARIARARAEELVNARQFDLATVALEETRRSQQSLDDEIVRMRQSLLTLTTSAEITVTPAAAAWELVDAYGKRHSGTGNAKIPALPFGPARVRASLTGFTPKDAELVLKRNEAAKIDFEFIAPRLTLKSVPQGARISANGTVLGTTPATIDLPHPGRHQIKFELEGHDPRSIEVSLAEASTVERAVALYGPHTALLGFASERDSAGHLRVKQIVPHGPADKAGVAKDAIISMVEKNGSLVSTTSLSEFQLLELFAGAAGTRLRMQVNDPSGATREVILVRMQRGAIEQARASAASAATVHFLRPFRIAGAAARLIVEHDGMTYELRSREQAVLRVPAGTLVVTMNLRSGVGQQGPGWKREFEVKEGSNYFDCDTDNHYVRLPETEGKALASTFRTVTGTRP